MEAFFLALIILSAIVGSAAFLREGKKRDPNAERASDFEIEG